LKLREGSDITTGFRETEYACFDWTELARERHERQSVVKNKYAFVFGKRRKLLDERSDNQLRKKDFAAWG
jgi:hypothetical protein